MDHPLQNPIIGQIAKAAVDGVQTAAAKPNELSPEAVQVNKSVIAVEVAKAVQQTPELQHILSTEAWYQSRANWAAIISFLTPIIGWGVLKFTGVEWTGLSQQDADMVAMILTTIGGFWASYLARRARTATKPLGA